MTQGQTYGGGMDPQSDSPLPDGLIAEEIILLRPLARFGTEELLAELELRFARFVFYGEDRKNDGVTRCVEWMHAPFSDAVGLLTYVLWKLQKRV